MTIQTAEAMWSDAVCKVGLLVCGDPEKVDRKKAGDEIIEILSIMHDRIDRNAAHSREHRIDRNAAHSRELQLYREIMLGLVAFPDRWRRILERPNVYPYLFQIFEHRGDPFERSKDLAEEQIIEHLEELAGIVDPKRETPKEKAES